ncbi:MAG: ABC transporter permease [Christensenellales bacterium]|jgi:peptide/nickel transport system permease protein
MLKFIIKRLLISIAILFAVMFIIYTIMRSLPADYVETVARELSTKPGSLPREEWIRRLNVMYGLDQNIVKGFFNWLGKAAKGEFGDSWHYTVPVTEKFKEVIWFSFYLGAAAFVLQMSISIPLGVLAAKKQYSATDYTVTVVALIGISLPTFFVATILKLIFSIKLQWFDISGRVSRNYDTLTPFGQFLDQAKQFVLPIVTLVVIGIGGMMRYTRTNMLEVLNSDYIRTARAKGLSERKVINHHAFRNTLIPIVTIIGGSLPGLFSGALITETLFSLGGIGFTSYTAMTTGDIPFTMFYLTFMAILTLLGTLIADILYAVVDPRVRVN